MRVNQMRRSDNAVAGIVTAILIVGLLVIVISLIQTIYVPKWMEEKESEHMSQVADQFSRLKYAIDIHSSTKMTNTPISTSITLGSKELPYLMSNRAFGSLEIEDGGCVITITNDEITPYSYSVGTIKYSSENAYYVDQEYIYECGAVLLSQSLGNTLLIKPSFSVELQDTIVIYFNVVNVVPIAGKDRISGFGTYPIQTEYLSSSATTQINNIESILIETIYTTAWNLYIKSTFINAGLFDTEYTITVVDGESVKLDFSGTDNVSMNLNYIEIGSQIAPGWIENTKTT
jgi:hypothetical protein